MSTEPISARKWVEARGKASTVIGYAPTAAEPGELTIVTCRESSRMQKSCGMMERQIVWDLMEVSKIGMQAVGVYAHVESGFNPYWLSPAVRMAKRIGASLTIRNTSRAIRSPDFRGDMFKEAQARECDLHDLRTTLDGVNMYSLLDPDASWEEEQAYERMSGAKAGKMIESGEWNPKARDDRRAMMEPMVIALYKQGHSLRAVEGTVALFAGAPYLFQAPNYTTVRRWIAQAA